MRIILKKSEIFWVGIAVIFFIILLVVGWLFIGKFILGVLIILYLLILLVVCIGLYNSNEKVLDTVKKQYRHIESLFSLFSLLKLNAPLPTIEGWAILPDELKIIADTIYERQPELVLELGSGVSTIVSAYCLRNLGKGKLVSFDHDQEFLLKTRKTLEDHDLHDIAKAIYAPLKQINIKGSKMLWYDTRRLHNIGKIDVLIIDGPPGDIQHYARYPALPLLFDKLSDEAIIILDDGIREDEKEIVRLWLKEFEGLSAVLKHTEKGTYIIRKSKKNSS